MKLMMKKFLLALLVILFIATAGWCINPYQANSGGFGPKIKGLQLGMKRQSLTDYVLWAGRNVKAPFYFQVKFAGLSESGSREFFYNKTSTSTMCFKVLDNEVNQFQYCIYTNAGIMPEPIDRFPDWLPSDLSFVGAIDLIEEEIIPEFKEAFPELRIKEIWIQGGCTISFYDNERISKIVFYTPIFGAGALTDKEFLQSFINAYDIPGMDFKGNNNWEHRNPSQGWQISYSGGGGWLFNNSIELVPIITNTSFD